MNFCSCFQRRLNCGGHLGRFCAALSLFSILCSLFSFSASAEIIYATEKGRTAQRTAAGQTTNETSFADERPFYLGAAYNYTMWEKFTDRPLLLDAHQNSSLDIMAGLRPLDWLRTEINYYHVRFDLAGRRLWVDGNAFFVNVIVDARMNHLYRFLSRQWFVPYVGVGAGVSWNNLHCDVPSLQAKMERHVPFTWTAMAGVAIEFNDSFALDLGYRYMHMASPKMYIWGYELDDLTPVSHQFRAGFRVSFGL